MPVEVRPAQRADMDRLVELAEWYLENTQFADALRFDPVVTRANFVSALLDRRARVFVGEYDGEVSSFLIARVDYWVMNDEPFLADVLLVCGPEPTHGAGLALLRAMHKELENNGITQIVVPIYSGLKQDKMVALLESMGYDNAGVVMKRGL